MRRRSLRFVVGEEVGAGPFRPIVRAAAEARAGPPRRVFAGFPLSPSGWQREQGSGKKKELLSLCDARTRLVGTTEGLLLALSISTSSAWRSYDPQSCRGPVGVVASHDCASVPAPGPLNVEGIVGVHLDVATIDATADVVVASELIPPLRSPASGIHLSNKGFAATFDKPVGPSCPST